MFLFLLRIHLSQKWFHVGPAFFQLTNVHQIEGPGQYKNRMHAAWQFLAGWRTGSGRTCHAAAAAAAAAAIEGAEQFKNAIQK